MSFAELLRVKGDEVKRSRSKRPLHLRLPKAVELAFIHLYSFPEPPPWPWQPWSALLFIRSDGQEGSSGIPERRIPEHGVEKIAIKVNWGKSNREIGKEMERLARAERPHGWGKPKQERPEKIFRAKLNALSVMRIWKRFPHREDRWKRIEEVGRCTGYKNCVNAFRAESTGTSDGAKVEMSRARDAALCFFQSLVIKVKCRRT